MTQNSNNNGHGNHKTHRGKTTERPVPGTICKRFWKELLRTLAYSVGGLFYGCGCVREERACLLRTGFVSKVSMSGGTGTLLAKFHLGALDRVRERTLGLLGSGPPSFLTHYAYAWSHHADLPPSSLPVGNTAAREIYTVPHLLSKPRARGFC